MNERASADASANVGVGTRMGTRMRADAKTTYKRRLQGMLQWRACPHRRGVGRADGLHMAYR